MAGYFRQLAEQALRPTTALRSTTAAPFAADRPRESMDEDPLRNSTPQPTRTGPGDDAPAPAHGGQLETGRMAERITLAPLSPGSSASIGDNQPPDVSASPPKTARRRKSVPNETHADVPLQAVVAKVAEDLGGERSGRRHDADDVAATFPRTPPRSRPGGPGTRSSGIAAPLTPARNQRIDVPRGPEITRHAGSGQAGPEVHIHIGRIELTAASPAGTTRREAGAGRKPLSLDAYLQQRRGKSP